MRTACALLLLCLVVLTGCPKPPPPPPPPPPATPRPATDPTRPLTSAVDFTLSSSALRDGQPIPARFTADGANVSPPLHWGKMPAEVRELVVWVRDADAPQGDFVHWIVYGIPPTMTGLPEGVRPDAAGFEQGVSDFGKAGWGGPDPPPGRTHHYLFVVMALRDKLYLRPPVDKQKVRAAVQDHILATRHLMATYRR